MCMWYAEGIIETFFFRKNLFRELPNKQWKIFLCLRVEEKHLEKMRSVFSFLYIPNTHSHTHTNLISSASQKVKHFSCL